MRLTIGISGGGIGGLAAAIALRAAGHEVEVYEQAPSFQRVGADINLTPNAVRALGGLGVVETLRETAARPTHRISRMWDSGEETSRLEMADAAERQYGAPQLTIHRADLLNALRMQLPPEVIRLGHRVGTVIINGKQPAIRLVDGTEHSFELVVGADGIHSVTRMALFGPEHPQFTGLVSYRAVVDRSRLSIPNLDAFTKWWGPTPDYQIVTFPLNRGRETFVFATTPQPDWREESWTMEGDVEELRRAYAAFHPEARALLDACETVTKSALYIRDPLPLVARPSHPSRRRLPPDGAVHGAGRLHGDRRRGRARPRVAGRGGSRRRECACALRESAQTAHRAYSDRLSRQRMAQRRRQRRLGLWL
jgi:salicylate hydroxylase